MSEQKKKKHIQMLGFLQVLRKTWDYPNTKFLTTRKCRNKKVKTKYSEPER